jgi:hypothetical protein
VSLTVRALNRALLERQMLLRRHDLSPQAAIERLVGMQAQEPLAPYTGLWTRLADFDPDDLSRMTECGEVVRGTLMRRTVHLVTADDYLALRPVMQDMVERGYASTAFARQIAGVDMNELLAAGRALVQDQPRTTAELRDALGPRWPEADGDSLAYAVRYHLPLVQLPPRGMWPSRKGHARARVTTAEHWLGRPLSDDASPQATIRRYLKAFGPATVQDIAAWSGLTKVREAVAAMELRRFEQWLDVEDAPLPDPDTPAPPRFLPPFDNVVLGHKDRSRIVADEDRPRLIADLGKPMLLVDGFVRGTWRIADDRLALAPWHPLTEQEQAAVDEEGERLLAFTPARGA